MQVDFRIKDFRFSGGVMINLDFARHLAEKRHIIRILWNGEGSQELKARAKWLPIFDAETLGSDDHARVTVFGFPHHAREVLSWRTLPVFFCQGEWWRDWEEKATSRDGIFGLFGQMRHRRKLRETNQAFSRPMPKVATTVAIGEYLRRFPGEVYVSPVGVDLRLFAPVAALSRRSCDTVLIVGPTSLKCKRVGNALQAAKLLKSRGMKILVLRASPEKMEPWEKALAVTDEYYEKLELEKMPALYNRADVVVMVSGEAEGFGLPAVEAMACGVPTVLSRARCFLSYSDVHDYARFVNIGDVEGIARGVEEVLRDEELRKRLRSRAFEVAREFSIERARECFEKTLIEIARKYDVEA